MFAVDIRRSILRNARSSAFQSFLRRQDLVDALERLEVLRVEVERLAEELDGLVLVALLVAVQLRHRVEELALADRRPSRSSAMAWIVSIIFDQFSVA